MLESFKNSAQKRLKDLLGIIKDRPKTTIAISVSLLLALAIRNYQSKLIYFPVIQGLPKSPNQNPHAFQHPLNQGITTDQILIKSADGIMLRGWYMKAQSPQRLIVYYHENAGNIGYRIPFCRQIIRNTQSNVLLVAYRGYSNSEGVATESGLKKDAVCILEKAIELGQQNSLPVVVYGRSLGGAAAVFACTQSKIASKVKGIILENTFTSIHDVAVNFFPKPLLFLVKLCLWLLLTNRWNSLSLIPKIRKPVLFIKSVKDELIPKSQMDKLQDVCEVRNYELLIPEGTHNQSWSKNPTLYFKELNLFLTHL